MARISSSSSPSYLLPLVRSSPGIIGRKNRYLIPPREIRKVYCPFEHNIVNPPFNCARENPLLLSGPRKINPTQAAVSPAFSNSPRFFMDNISHRIAPVTRSQARKPSILPVFVVRGAKLLLRNLAKTIEQAFFSTREAIDAWSVSFSPRSNDKICDLNDSL